jgi:hypothetical protein
MKNTTQINEVLTNLFHGDKPLTEIQLRKVKKDFNITVTSKELMDKYFSNQYKMIEIAYGTKNRITFAYENLNQNKQPIDETIYIANLTNHFTKQNKIKLSVVEDLIKQFKITKKPTNFNLSRWLGVDVKILEITEARKESSYLEFRMLEFKQSKDDIPQQLIETLLKMFNDRNFVNHKTVVELIKYHNPTISYITSAFLSRILGTTVKKVALTFGGTMSHFYIIKSKYESIMKQKEIETRPWIFNSAFVKDLRSKFNRRKQITKIDLIELLVDYGFNPQETNKTKTILDDIVRCNTLLKTYQKDGNVVTVYTREGIDIYIDQRTSPKPMQTRKLNFKYKSNTTNLQIKEHLSHYGLISISQINYILDSNNEKYPTHYKAFLKEIIGLEIFKRVYTKNANTQKTIYYLIIPINIIKQELVDTLKMMITPTPNLFPPSLREEINLMYNNDNNLPLIEFNLMLNRYGIVTTSKMKHTILFHALGFNVKLITNTKSKLKVFVRDEIFNKSSITPEMIILIREHFEFNFITDFKLTEILGNLIVDSKNYKGILEMVLNKELVVRRKTRYKIQYKVFEEVFLNKKTP